MELIGLPEPFPHRAQNRLGGVTLQQCLDRRGKATAPVGAFGIGAGEVDAAGRSKQVVGLDQHQIARGSGDAPMGGDKGGAFERQGGLVGLSLRPGVAGQTELVALDDIVAIPPTLKRRQVVGADAGDGTGRVG